MISTVDRQEAILAALRECPLYFILDESLLDVHDPLKLTREVLSAGVRMLQLRLKSPSLREQLELAGKLRKLTDKHGCLLIVNDRIDVALLSGADGVHLGEHDAPVADARRIAPRLIIGATARTPKAAWQAEVDDADYLGCGSVFGSATKPGLPQIGVSGLSKIDRYVSIPVVGIGGINLSNAGEVLASGVAGLCSIEPFRNGNPRDVVKAFVKLRRESQLAEYA